MPRYRVSLDLVYKRVSFDGIVRAKSREEAEDKAIDRALNTPPDYSIEVDTIEEV